MLVKCVCSNCSHSYLADDQAGDLSCPRCGVPNEHTRNPSDIPDPPIGAAAGVYDPYLQPDDDVFGMEGELRFDPQEPPPMILTRDRVARGMIFGGLTAMAIGAVLGGALAAVKFIVPAVLAIVLALFAGPAVRYGFGGRCAGRTRRRAIAALAVVMLAGGCGFLAGSWAVERFTGTRADQVRDDLARGLTGLLAQRTRVNDEGMRIVLEQRIAEVNRLQALSDAQLEDYVWTQQGGINQPLLAYAYLRAWKGPVLRFGDRDDPIEAPAPAPSAILLAEMAFGLWLAWQLVKPR